MSFGDDVNAMSRLAAIGSSIAQHEEQLAALYQARDDLIRKMYASGARNSALATLAGISRARVSQLVRDVD